MIILFQLVLKKFLPQNIIKLKAHKFTLHFPVNYSDSIHAAKNNASLTLRDSK